MIIAAAPLARIVVICLLTNFPIISFRLVNMTKGMIAKGSPKERTTWLITSVRVGFNPIKITSSAGNMVTKRRTQAGI